MILEDIIGITNLDATAPIFDEESSNQFLGNVSLRQVLLSYLRLSDGHQLIAEVHQTDEIMGPVQAVIPNTPEAERMILMMNKNVQSAHPDGLRVLNYHDIHPRNVDFILDDCGSSIAHVGCVV